LSGAILFLIRAVRALAAAFSEARRPNRASASARSGIPPTMQVLPVGSAELDIGVIDDVVDLS